jgi:mono/diheme cytochrome c family protein
MRERIAIAISILTVALLVTLSALFAVRQDRELAAASPPAETGTAGVAADSARGRAVYLAQRCARCHSVDGAGSRRSPLDGVGARRTRAELLAWTVADAVVEDSLSPSAARAKRRYRHLPDEDIRVLITYLERLQSH